MSRVYIDYIHRTIYRIGFFLIFHNYYKQNLIFTAIIDGGSGGSQFNSILSAIGIPTLSFHTAKKYEEQVGPIIEEIARNSCRDALYEERESTIAAECPNE